MGLAYHGRPARKFASSKHVSGQTPYHWKIKEDGGWRIGFGASSFLVAEGSGFSVNHGKKFLRQMQDEWLLRQKARRPKAIH